MKNKRSRYAKNDEELTGLRNVQGAPETSFDMLNKYGTYEIQPTSETDNEYPKIAQGVAKKEKK
ncbi:MAG: hypothetical protein KBS52_04435 [Clostridiales bacterium]|nr:hypothetical protein [Candidatus Equinaster intestinalis]